AAGPGRTHVILGEHRYRGEHDYGADSDLSDRASNEMVWSWNHTGAHAAFERGRVCRDWFCSGSHRSRNVPDFAPSRRLRAASTSARSSLYRVAARDRKSTRLNSSH